MLEVPKIREIIPHRYPFLLIDRVLELDPGKKAVGIKNVTINEPFFQGHYPDYPLMPGVLIIESMAQLAGIALDEAVAEGPKIPLFAGIDKARFRRQVVPGDQMHIEIDVLKVRSRLGKVHGIARVDDEIVAEADLMFMFEDPADL